MNVRFTAFSISSTHMKMMIALRRVRTPTTPITKSAAESASDSASTRIPPSPKHHRPRNRHEQENARQLEREQIFIEQRPRDRPHCPVFCELVCREPARNFVFRRDIT